MGEYDQSFLHARFVTHAMVNSYLLFVILCFNVYAVQ